MSAILLFPVPMVGASMACRGTVRNVLRTHPDSQADNNTEREALGFLPSFSSGYQLSGI